jgi:DNA polymerase III epsilon subunit-like protein
MELVETYPLTKSYFLFDLEFIGDVRVLETCRIWEIAVFSMHTSQWFTAIVDPDPSADSFPPPPIPEIPPLTRQFLNENNAQLWSSVCVSLAHWIQQQASGSVPIFISHNTFRADKPILELEFQRISRLMPLNWYFFDSLHYSRRMIKNPTGNYSLSGLHQQLFGKPIENAHRAKADVIACMKIMAHITTGGWELAGPMYPSYSTALRTIRWIGQKAEEILYNGNVRSVEQLYTILLAQARTDKLAANVPYSESILNTLTNLMRGQLPIDNIKNIANVIQAARCPFSLTFMDH